MQRLAILHNPLGPKLRFHHMSASEQLSQVPKYTLDLLSDDPDIDFSKLLGQHMSVELALPEGAGESDRQTFVADNAGGPGKRYFDGIVTRISYTGMKGRHHQYRVILQPWLALLSKTHNCRIFQDKNVLQILKEVFQRLPEIQADFADMEDELTVEYTPWPYCVQYMESDLNFVLRLLEQEGISFYFTHRLGRHQLVLIDSIPGKNERILPGYETISYKGQARSATTHAESILTWHRTEQVMPGRVALTDFDFTRPSTDLQQSRTDAREHHLAEMEVFAYPGFYDKEGDGEQFARTQMEAYKLLTQQAGGTSDARGLACGRTFTLEGFFRTQDNIRYLVTGTSILLTQAQEEGMHDGGGTATFVKDQTSPGTSQTIGQHGSSYRCEFSVIDATIPFRPQRGATLKPRVQGPQTAIVVGPKDEEIHTDEYGRVKVHFHWDRYGKKDGDDTCWVRVSQVWAGKNFGFQAIPRVGQEVVVDFLEGDPDQPLITGRVYNAEQMTPWDLPANKTQTGVLTRSTPHGNYHTANAIRFEDKKGHEQLWLHAEKDQLTEVENCETKTVGVNRSKTIGKNETNHIKGNRTETVGVVGGKEGTGDEKITVYGNRTEEVGVAGKGGDEKITIYGKRTEQVELDEQITINGNRYTLVNQGENTRIRGNRAHVVGKNLLDQVAGNKRVAIGKNYNIEAGDTFSITCGASVFYMDKDGNVFITAKNFNFTASEKVQINGQEEVHLNPEEGAAAVTPSPKGAKAIGDSVRAQFKSTW